MWPDTRPTVNPITLLNVREPYEVAPYDPLKSLFYTTEYNRQFTWKVPNNPLVTPTPLTVATVPAGRVRPDRLVQSNGQNVRVTFPVSNRAEVVDEAVQVETAPLNSGYAVIYRESANQTLESSLNQSKPVKRHVEIVREYLPTSKLHTVEVPTSKTGPIHVPVMYQTETRLAPKPVEILPAGLPSDHGPHSNLDPNFHSFLSYGWANEPLTGEITGHKSFNITVPVSHGFSIQLIA